MTSLAARYIMGAHSGYEARRLWQLYPSSTPSPFDQSATSYAMSGIAMVLSTKRDWWTKTKPAWTRLWTWA